MIFDFFVGIVLICFVYIVLQLYFGRRPKHFPPGPISLPIFGNLLQIGVQTHIKVFNMRKKYGDIIAIDLGTRRAIFINEYKLLKELHALPISSGRPNFEAFSEQETGIFRGLAFASGRTWQEQRRFTFSYIHAEFREGNNREKLVMNEIKELVSEMKKNCGTPISTRNFFNMSAINSLWTIIAGRRYSLTDKSFNDMIQHITTIISSVAFQGLLIFFPKFSKLFPRLSGYGTIRNEVTPVYAFMKNIIDEHKETYQEGIQRDFVDSYLSKIKTTTDPQSSFYGKIGEKNLEQTLFDLFLTGTDTVATTLIWSMFLLAHFPEVQKALIDAIKELKYETEEEISLKERPGLPYVDAVIQEVLRFSSFVQLGIFHEALQEFDFHGYKIPKGTLIVANQYGIMHDPEVWNDPEDFNPKRFLTEDGSKVINHPAYVPFGVGRRVCPGELFSKDSLFLFVANIFKNFRIEFDPSEPNPPVNYVIGQFLFPVNHKIVLHNLSK